MTVMSTDMEMELLIMKYNQDVVKGEDVSKGRLRHSVDEEKDLMPRLSQISHLFRRRPKASLRKGKIQEIVHKNVHKVFQPLHEAQVAELIALFKSLHSLEARLEDEVTQGVPSDSYKPILFQRNITASSIMERRAHLRLKL